MSEEAAPTEGAEAKKSKFSLAQIALAGQLLVMLGVGGFMAKVALTPRKVDLRESTIKERAIASIHDDLDSVQFVELPYLTVNIAQKHTIRAKIQVEVSNEAVAQILHKKDPAIRARILNILSGQHIEDAERIQGKLLIKDAIRDALNEEISTVKSAEGVVRDVYFMEFLLI